MLFMWYLLHHTFIVLLFINANRKLHTEYTVAAWEESGAERVHWQGLLYNFPGVSSK